MYCKTSNFSNCLALFFFFFSSLYTQLGGLFTRASGLRLPNLPSSARSLLYKLVGEDTPPQLYSGATIQVQRSQRTDEIERMMNEMQQRRHRRVIRIGRPVQGQLPQPSEDQVYNIQCHVL